MKASVFPYKKWIVGGISAGMLISSYAIIHTDIKIGLGLQPSVLLGACLAVGVLGLGLKNRGLIGAACLAGIILCERLHFLETQAAKKLPEQSQNLPLQRLDTAQPKPQTHPLALPAVYLHKERTAQHTKQ